MLAQAIDLILHIDVHLQYIVSEYSIYAYAILFLIVFLETGVVVTPFLPGDSLLFAAGALAAAGAFNLALLFTVIFFAAILGDTLNYHLGKYFGPRIFRKDSSFFFNKNYLKRAEEFYEKNGKKTIILARFIPIIRTFAPFVAGIGRMSYGIFIVYNILGALLWSSLFIFGGFLFGNIPVVKENFGLMVIAIIVISFIPFIKEIYLMVKAKGSKHKGKIIK